MSDKSNSRFIPQEPVTGNQINMLNKRKVLQGTSAQGEPIEIEAGGSIVRPDGNGGLEDVEITKLDQGGFPIPKDLSGHGLSHTGIVTPLHESGECTFFLHPKGISKLVYIGRDGERRDSGVICSLCLAWLTLIKQLLAIIGVGIFIGFLIGIF